MSPLDTPLEVGIIIAVILLLMVAPILIILVSLVRYSRRLDWIAGIDDPDYRAEDTEWR